MPEHTPTTETRELVERMCMAGIPETAQAQVVGISRGTLRRHYKEILRLSLLRKNAEAAELLWQKVRAGNVTALIFWLKCRAGWKETMAVQPLGKDGEPADAMPSRIIVEGVWPPPREEAPGARPTLRIG